MRNNTITNIFAFLFVTSTLLLNGCAPLLLVGSGATAAVMTNDERSAGSFIEDQGIELKVLVQIAEELGEQVQVNATSYNRRVLLTGQAPSEELRQRAEKIVGQTKNVKEVLNQLVIGNPSSLTSRTADSALTLKVKTALCRLRDAGFSCLDVKIVTEQGVVYLLGLVTEEQEKIAVDAVRRISGVLAVNTLFERA